MGEVIRTARAKEDLRKHAIYISNDNPEAAERFLDAAEAGFARLAEMPGLGAPIETVVAGCGNLRRWPVPRFRSYLIFYRPAPSGVEILRAPHGARDPDRILEEELEA